MTYFLEIDPEIIAGVAGFVIVASLTILGRLMWSGFRETIVKAVVESSLGKLLSGVERSLADLKSDMGFIKENQSQNRMSAIQITADVQAVRQRFDAHVDVDQTMHDDYFAFKHEIMEFVEWAKKLIHDHPPTPPATPAP